MTIAHRLPSLHLACAVVAMLALHSCIPEPACAATPLQLRWTAELSDPKPYNAVLFAGESADLVATLKLYGRAVALETNATAALYWQTNGMGSAWWQSPATVTTAGVVTASWTPAMDAGADLYRWHLGVANAASSTIYRAFGAFRMQGSPGATPNVIAPPVRWIDFDLVAISNAPWATLTDVDAAISDALEGYEPGGGGVIEETDPVAMPALISHVGQRDNPHGVTAAQVGALGMSWPSTGTVYHATAAGSGSTWVTARDGSGWLLASGRAEGVAGDYDAIIVSEVFGEGYNGPDPGTVLMLSPSGAYTSGVWSIELTPPYGVYLSHAEPDRITWYAEGSIPDAASVELSPDVEAAIGTVSLSWYGVGTVSEQLVTTPALQEVADAIDGLLSEEVDPHALHETGGEMSGPLVLHGASGITWQGVGIETNFTVRVEYDGTNLNFNVYEVAR